MATKVNGPSSHTADIPPETAQASKAVQHRPQIASDTFESVSSEASRCSSCLKLFLDAIGCLLKSLQAAYNWMFGINENKQENVTSTSIVRYVPTEKIESAELADLQKITPRGVFSLILSYAGDPTLPNDDQTYKLILDAYRDQDLLSRFMLDVPSNVASEECQARVMSIYREVLNLAARWRVTMYMGSALDKGMAPLALNRIVQAMKMVEGDDLIKLFEKESYREGNTIREQCPSIELLLPVVKKQKCDQGEDTIRTWMREHPEELARVVKLSLEFDDRDGVSTLPPEIGMFVNLQELHLHRCPWRELPRCIGKFVNLRTLELWNNQLHELPNWIIELDKLSRLVLWSKTLTVAPELRTALQQRGCTVIGPTVHD